MKCTYQWYTVEKYAGTVLCKETIIRYSNCAGDITTQATCLKLLNVRCRSTQYFNLVIDIFYINLLVSYISYSLIFNQNKSSLITMQLTLQKVKD